MRRTVATKLTMMSCWILAYSCVEAASPPTVLKPLVENLPVLSLTVADEYGRPVMARLRLWNDQDEAQSVELLGTEKAVLIHPRYPKIGIVFPGQGQVQLPEGHSSIQIERGTEYRPVRLELNTKAGDALDRKVKLERWVHMKEKGWWPGDLHVHRQPSDMPALVQASDIHFAPTLTHWNNRPLLEQWPEQKTYRQGSDRIYTINNSEDERGWGAGLFLGLSSPVQLYPGRTEYPPPTLTWKEAREKAAYIDLEKLIWWQAPVITALISPDSVGLANNHFMEEGLLATEAWGRPRDRLKYPGNEGFAHYIFDLYYKYLSAGFRLPASAGSANGVLKNPLGYNRSYVLLGEEFSREKWLAGQKAGRNFVTNGPMMFFTANGQGPGGVLGDAGSVEVRLTVVSANEIERVELIVDGEVSLSVAPGRNEFQGKAQVTVSQGGWLAARCFEKNSTTVRFAHTSPVYVGETPRRSAAAVEYLRSWVETDIQRVRWLAPERLSGEQKQEVTRMCEEALAVYHEMEKTTRE